MEMKPWYASKTVWFNVVATILDILALTQFGEIVPAAAAPYIALAQGVGNVILRRLSTGGIAFTAAGRNLVIVLALLAPLPLVGCTSTPETRGQVTHRLALVSESYAVALQRLQAWEISQHRAGVVAEADHVVWQRRIERMALAGKAANDAIRASQLVTVQAQARAILDVVDELVAEQVIRFSEQQRLTATVILESLRTAVIIWSATLDVRTLGPSSGFDQVLAHNGRALALEAN